MPKPAHFLLSLLFVLTLISCSSGGDSDDGTSTTDEGPVIIEDDSGTLTDDDPVIELGDPVNDIDGNAYQTVIIGEQTWMKSNLRVTKYPDGTVIPVAPPDVEWGDLTTPAYHQTVSYGRLYNGFTFTSGDPCPDGFHVPTDADWDTLFEFVGGIGVAGGILKEMGTTNWTAPNEGAKDTYGFTALPAGLIYDIDGSHLNQGTRGYWLRISDVDPSVLNTVAISNDSENANFAGGPLNFGASCRCVKD